MKLFRGFIPRSSLRDDNMLFELHMWPCGYDFDTRTKVTIAAKEMEDVFMLADEQMERLIESDPGINWCGQLYDEDGFLMYERRGVDELWDEWVV